MIKFINDYDIENSQINAEGIYVDQIQYSILVYLTIVVYFVS